MSKQANQFNPPVPPVPVSAKVSTPPAHPISPAVVAVEALLAKEITVKVGTKEHKFKSVAQIYLDGDDEAKSSIKSVAQFQEIKDKLIDLCQRKPADIAKLLSDAEKIFEERAVAKVQFENVKNEQLRIRRKEFKPYELDLAEFAGNIPADQVRQNMNNWFGYNPRSIESPTVIQSSIKGATEDEMKAILEGRTRHPFIQNPGKLYRNAVFDTEVIARDDLRVNSKKLQKFLTGGVAELDRQEELKLRKFNRAQHEASNVLQFAGYSALELSKLAGRGLISNTEASESANYREYNKQRNKALYEMLWKACPGENRTSYFHLLKSRNAALLNSGDPESKAMAEEMNKELDAMLKRSEEEDAKRFKELQEKIEQHGKDTLGGYVEGGKRIGGLQSHIDKQDDAHKWMLMCAFIAAGPFTGVLFAPILGNILGPVLAGSGSFAHQLSLLTTNPIFGPFAKIAEVFHIPDAISWVLHNVPIIEQLSDIMNFVTRNPIAEGLFAEVLPLASSPLVALGLAGLAATAGISQQYLLHTDKQDFLDGRKKSLEGMTKSFVKDSEKLRDARIQEGTVRSLNAAKSLNRLTKLSQFIAGADDDLLSAIGIKFHPEEQINLAQIRNDAVAIKAFLQEKDNAKTTTKAMNEFLFFESVGRDLVKFAAVTDAATKQSKVTEQATKLDQDFVIKWGKDFEIIDDSQNRDQQCKTAEAAFLRREREYFKDLPYSILPPSPTVEQPKAEQFQRSKDDLELLEKKGKLEPRSRDALKARQRIGCNHQPVRCC